MREYTTNLGLVKPDKTDQYNVADFNDNMQKIDDFSGLTPPRALTADKLTVARNINGVAFDGTKNVITGLGLHSMTETYSSTNLVYNFDESNQLKLFRSKQDGNQGHATTEIDWWEEVSIGGAGMPVGTIITSTASSSYTPENTVYTDGTEYAEAQFTKTYSLLESGQLKSCTYEEYENSITQTGECWICALDTANQKFKVPTIKDIVVRGIKDTIEVEYGNGVKRGTGEDVSGQPVDVAGIGPISGAYTTLMYSKTTSSSVYGYSSELGNSALQADTQASLITQTIRHYYVVATGSINQSEMDWSAWASSLQGKANTDLSNLNTTGKEEITNLCLPDYNSGIDITSNLKTPPYSYTPPVNGIIRFLARGDVEWIIANTASATNDDSANILVNLNGATAVNISTILQIGKNQTIYEIGAHEGTSAIFYPLKGVEND